MAPLSAPETLSSVLLVMPSLALSVSPTFSPLLLSTAKATASVLAAPGAVVIAKILFPQTEPIEQKLEVSMEQVGSNFLDAMSETRLQEDYNKAVRSCDIFLSLFKTKTGTFTEEEFNVAYQKFKTSGKPLIYTYFLQPVVIADESMRRALTSLWDFKAKLKNLGHYPTECTSLADLKLQFQTQLDLLINNDMI